GFRQSTRSVIKKAQHAVHMKGSIDTSHKAAPPALQHTAESNSIDFSLRLANLYWVLLEGFIDLSCYVCVTFDLGAATFQQTRIHSWIRLPSATLAEAKENHPSYLSAIKKAEIAARKFLSDNNKRVSDEFKEVWNRDDCPYNYAGVYKPATGAAFLAGDVYRHEGERDHYFAGDCCKILYASNAQLDPLPETDYMEPYGNITHMTALISAFAEIKVRSLLAGEE
ncbi:TPA: hypothetical protein ACH3X1_015680, partial [Trebouxia sp. C0004]